ncbi:MAG TPA: SWIM zinc finger family protein [Steroidobacteraceae bacterium]|nr:SWIM zinc finger family protein [Steroidobacteraceae bacterium]
MSEWSVSRVEQLAPDGAAVKAAQGLAKPAKWQSLGRDERHLWGECQGSGANPYQVRVDLEVAAYKCSCPSRKQPCKHTLGLLLMLAGGTSIPSAAPPAFVEEWIAGRAKRAEAKATRAVAPDKPPDPEAQARRADKRESRIEGGLAQLESWLADCVAQGLAATRARPSKFWSEMAARLVDAQAPGLARRVYALSELAVSGENWQSDLLAGMARLQLLIDAYRRLDKLPAPLAAEVRTQVGWTQSRESLLERAGVREHWHVLGHRQSQDDQLRTQYTWLAGLESGRFAMLLEFAIGNQPLPATLRIGQVVDAELVYFDGAPLLRALVKQRFEGAPPRHSLPAALDVAGLQREFAARLAENPLLERWPAVLGPVTTLISGAGRGTSSAAQMVFVDSAGRRVPAVRWFRHGWLFDALAGGGSLRVFGQWDGRAFDPISVEHEGRLYSLAHVGELPALSKVA